MEKRRMIIPTVFLCMWFLALVFPGVAPAEFPEKNIFWVVPTEAGGGFDVYSRAIIRVMPKYLPKEVNIVVKNMPGAGFAVGTSYLYRAKPDGYTMGIVNYPGMDIAARFQKTEYETEKFVYLGALGKSVYILAVPANSPFKSIEDLQKADKPVRFASEGKGSTGDFMLRVGTKSMNIPTQIVTGYKGAPPVLLAAIKGDVDASLYGSLEVNYRFIQSGELKPLCVFDTERSKLIPDTPTITELGYGQELTEISLLRVVAVPPGTPREIADILRQAVRRALEEETTQKWAKEQNAPLIWIPEERVLKTIKSFGAIAQRYGEFFK